MRTVRIGLVGDRNDAYAAHRAIPEALALAATAAGVMVETQWIPTTEVAGTSLEALDAVWCIPGSPYASMAGALTAIRFAREHNVPFLGTCGGFQHAVIEYARNVLGLADADHAESNPGAAVAVITPLVCRLVGTEGAVRFLPDASLLGIYGAESAEEGYSCSYGLAPDFRERLMSGALRVAALDSNGDVRAVELSSHRFFFSTLFQPERWALTGRTHPLIVAFVRAAA